METVHKHSCGGLPPVRSALEKYVDTVTLLFNSSRASGVSVQVFVLRVKTARAKTGLHDVKAGVACRESCLNPRIYLK